MDYEQGCENYHFRETWRERHGFGSNFLNRAGIAIMPMLFMIEIAIAVLIFFPKR